MSERRPRKRNENLGKEKKTCINWNETTESGEREG